jgi:lysophospholipase L1-like esterase
MSTMGTMRMTKKLLLPAAALWVLAACAIPTVRAQDTVKKELTGSVLPADSSGQKEVVYDGAEIGANAKSWVGGGTAGKVTGAAQDKVVRTAGKKTVEFHGEGSGWMGTGWNWFGWWPEDGGTDITRHANLRFWAKVTGQKLPPQLNVTLTSNDKKSTQGASLLKYCPELMDGKWHEIVIPIADLDTKNELNKAKVWEILLGAWSQEDVNFSLFVDEIAFGGAGGKAAAGAATTAPAAAAVAVAAGPATALPVEVDAKDPAIRYIGRWDMTNPSAPRAAWTCSTVTAKFKGTAINAKLQYTGTFPASFYQVTVDGQPTSVIEVKKGQDLYPLASGLEDKPHVVEIIRRNEAGWMSPFVFAGFQLEKGGRLLPLPPRSLKRILIIGDSISCGYGNEAQRDEGNPPAKENGYMTYGAIAARKLGAEVQIVAWSGRRMHPTNTMSEVYDRVLGQDEKPKADLKAWVPGVVLIDLGTNDFGDKKAPPEEKGWIAAYKDFIKTIRQTAPKAHIFIASGPMGTAPEWDKWAKQIVADVNAAGDKNVSYLPFPTQDVNGDGIGGHWHPNIKTQTKMGDRLATEIEKAVGWKPVAADK